MDKKSLYSLRKRLYVIIFDADTPAGKAFDVALLWAIVLSVFAVMLESVRNIESQFGFILRTVEWFFTILFTIEYITRIIASPRPFKYIFSFLGIIDLLAVIPTYLSLVLAGSQYLLVMRTIRLLRVFRIFKLTRYLGEARVLVDALKASRFKITVFLVTILSIVIIMGTIMYLVEGAENGFTSIPRSIYWAIVTLTTVGYGDIAPKTIVGQVISSIIMIMGYGIIAVPTGIVTAELTSARDKSSSAGMATTSNERICPGCGSDNHDPDARYCKYCGNLLVLG